MKRWRKSSLQSYEKVRHCRLSKEEAKGEAKQPSKPASRPQEYELKDSLDAYTQSITCYIIQQATSGLNGTAEGVDAYIAASKAEVEPT